jgi:hypothetical protein
VALVIRVGCFYSGGYTETGGIDQFLKNLRSDIEWVRCFPAHDKPAPKLKKHLREPAKKHGGVTGKSLVDRMLERLRQQYADDHFDLVLFIDDVDCRFNDASGVFDKQRFDAYRANLESQVREAKGEPLLRFLALLASPEIEAWLLADWERGFGKLSTDLQKALEELALSVGGDVDQDTYTYSKKNDGPLMLQRLRPDKVSEICTRYFQLAYRELLSLQASAPPPPPPAEAPVRGAKRPAGRASRRR